MALNFTVWRNPLLKSWMQSHVNYLGRVVNLGTPLVADADKIVTIANMKVGTYTIAAQPDVPRNITVTHATVATGTDTLGTITVVGTNILDEVISEVITPSADTTVAGDKAFKTVTSVTGAGWVIAGGNDTITVGIGNKLGLPFVLGSTDEVIYSILGTTIIAPTVAAGGTVEGSTVDNSSGTYNGSKKAIFVVVE